MAIVYGAGARSSQVDAVAARVAGGAIEVYGGAPPAGVALDPTGQALLVSLPLPSPAFAPAVDGGAQAAPIAPAAALVDGDATWYRVLNAQGAAQWRGSVSAPGEGGDMELLPPRLVKDVQVVVTSMVLTAAAVAA